MRYRMSVIYGHPVIAATRALRFVDHVTKRNGGSGDENDVRSLKVTCAVRFLYLLEAMSWPPVRNSVSKGLLTKASYGSSCFIIISHISNVLFFLWALLNSQLGLAPQIYIHVYMCASICQLKPHFELTQLLLVLQQDVLCSKLM